MKWYRLAYLSTVIIGVALALPQRVTAQSVSAANLPFTRAGAVDLSSKSPQPSPVVAYVRPTQKEKLRLFEFDAFGPYAFAKAGLSGGFQQASNSPPEWGGGSRAFGMRVASNFGIQLVTTTTRYGMAAMLHEDAAYYRCECRGFLPRLGHALLSTFTARRGEDGHSAFSFSAVVSPYAGTMTALAWYPNRYGVKDGFRMGNYNLAGQAAGNLALEFIYGGPHTLLRHLGRSRSPDAVVQN
jgi:hypothetical protein